MAFQQSQRRKCRSIFRITAKSLLSWLAVAATTGTSWVAGLSPEQTGLPLIPVLPPLLDTHSEPLQPAEHEFTLRHVFHRGTTLYPELHRRLDVQTGISVYERQPITDDLYTDTGPFAARSSALNIRRLADRDVGQIMEMEANARRGGYRPVLPEAAWTVDEVAGPNITDKETVVNLARMAASAYNQGPEDPDWQDVKEPFNRTQDFGWQGDGLRGHVFADKMNSTIVISIKGTSKAVFDGAETTTNDKENDNLFFGCCCGQGGSSFLRQVCDCATDTYTCNTTCVTEALKKENRYWRASIDLYDNVTALYPNTSNIWLVGHSLGGAVSALLGLTVGQPAVTFEAPGDALAASRLGLPVPPGQSPGDPPQKRLMTGAFHFGHNADPVFTGTCNGWGASCVLGGYALESQCHTGMRCEYDMQKDWNWRNVMTNHGIKTCLKNVYEVYDQPAKCVPDSDCDADCFKWKFYKSNGSEITTTRTTTSASTSLSLTRTETCKTPGWWGCLDESSTTTTTTGAMSTCTSTLATTTCSSYGWFGRCLDPITTTYTITTTVAKMTRPATAPTTLTTEPTTATCTSHGWLGRCLDIKRSSASDCDPQQITPAPVLELELR